MAPSWPLALFTRLFLLLLLFFSHLVSALGSKRMFLEVTIPERLSYEQQPTEKLILNIKMGGNPYTILLSQQSFLTNDFRVYTYDNTGSVMSYSPSIQRNCFHHGYVVGNMDSLVMLNLCSGVSGLIQIGNISYGIEPVDTASSFHHLVYQIDYNDAAFNVSKNNYSIKSSPEIFGRANPDIPVNFSTVRYVEVHVIVAKMLFSHMGANEEKVMGKIMQLFCFINAMFYKLNLRIVLSSLEFWAEKDEILTRSPPGEILEEFVKWKQTHLTLRPHDVTFLFVYNSTAESLGATFSKKMCSKSSSTGIAVYQNEMTLEAFSVVVTQLLGLTLGIYFDDDRECICPRVTCLMDTKAVQSSGVKSFSSCSISDFQKHLRLGTSECLMNRPHGGIAYRAPHCGNLVVEDGEQCDCGTPEECKRHPCCEPDCTLKKGAECAYGECCWLRTCKLKARGILCRESPDRDCDLKEYCNGTSPMCTEDFHVEDGQYCEKESGVCLKGLCQSPDLWCQKYFGKDSKSGSQQCYEEINSQNDRMGNCGVSAHGYTSCQWQDLRCGKLVCEYLSKKPVVSENAAIIYVRVQNRICVTMDFMKGVSEKDPFLIQDGASCGTNKICMRQKCVDRSILKVTCDPRKNCNNRGHCNNKGHCHCNPGWAPPDCGPSEKGGIGGSIDSTFRSGTAVYNKHTLSPKNRNWLLVGFFFILPLIVGSIFLLKNVRHFFSRVKVEEEREDEEDYDTTEGSRSETADHSETASV